MRFIEGQTVVRPHHGPATVRQITTRTVGATESRYFMLQIQDKDLVVGVPVDNADAIGLRTVFNQAEVDRLFAVLRGPTGQEETQWARRIKDSQEKLRSGDIYAVAQVVRNLIRRAERNHLSPVEKSMLKYAKQPLVTELSLALALAPAEAETLVDSLPCGIATFPPATELAAS